MTTHLGTTIRRHRAPRRSRPGRRIAGALTIAALAVATVLPFLTIAPAGAMPAAAAVDDALTHARAQLQGCRDLRQYDTRNATDRTWADTCVRLWAREVDRLTGPSPSPTSPPVTTGPPTTTTPPPATTPPPTSTPSPTPPAAGSWPTPADTGVPAGWVPVSTRTTDLRVTTVGAVVEDIQFNSGADLIIDAADVTVRRVEFLGGGINNRPGPTCRNGLRIEQTTFRRPGGTVTDSDQEGAVRTGGYTADRVQMDGVTEGFRVGGRGSGGCGPVGISNSWIRVQSPDVCADWHGDGVQGFDGNALTIRNSVFWLDERGGCGGTAPYFYPSSQGNSGPVDIERLLVRGGGYSFRNGMPGRVVDLKIVNDWGYGPLDVRCPLLSEWSAQIVTVDASWQPTTVREQPCNTNAG